MAAHDLFVWTNQVQAQLPNGVGAVQVVGTTPPTFTINVTWQETGLGPVTYQMAIRVPNL
jgi:hypothetical protein